MLASAVYRQYLDLNSQFKAFFVVIWYDLLTVHAVVVYSRFPR